MSSLSTNLIANYVPSQNTLINFFPNSLTLKKTGIVIAIVGLIISTFWLSIFSKGNVLIFVEAVATTFGPIFGVLVADYYLFKKQQIINKKQYDFETASKAMQERVINAVRQKFAPSAPTTLAEPDFSFKALAPTCDQVDPFKSERAFTISKS